VRRLSVPEPSGRHRSDRVISSSFKFLLEKNSQELLFKTLQNSEPIGSFRIGDLGAYHQKTYAVSTPGGSPFFGDRGRALRRAIT
jgi:hypothetical protein